MHSNGRIHAPRKTRRARIAATDGTVAASQTEGI
jgi:hypothetical protein